jgi:GxxExxY protein
MSEVERSRLNGITAQVIDAAILIHKDLGPGLMESVYETAMALELMSRGFEVRRQVAIPVIFRGNKLDDGFRCDLLINNSVIVELKSVESLAPVFYKQLLTYLRLADRRVGLLINFNEAQVKDGIHRVVNNF